MEGCEDMQFKQCAIIKCLTVEKKFLPLTFTVECRQFKQQEVGEASLCNKARSGRPVTATGMSHQECIEDDFRKLSNQTERNCP
jgi:hypothetical protein